MVKPVWTPGVASAPSAGINFSKSSLSHLHHRCCSLCMALCLGCPAGRMEADEVVAAVLGLGGPSYKYVYYIYFKYSVRFIEKLS